MPECEHYLSEARIAVRLEQNESYHAAMLQWQKAERLARKVANQTWANLRTQFCEYQHKRGVESV